MIYIIKSFLRQRATGNGCEVVLPWFPEARPTSDALRLIRRTRIEPKGSNWINAPLALLLWMILSTLSAFSVWKESRKIVRQHFGVGSIRQFAQLIHLAWWKNVCPLEYYEFQYYLKKTRDQAEFYLPAVRQGRISAQLNANRDGGKVNHKLHAYRNLTKAGLPNPEVLEVFYKDGTREFSSNPKELDPLIGRDFFVKPVNSYGGIGAEKWLYDRTNQCYSNGIKSVPAHELWNVLAEEAKHDSKCDSNNEARLLQELVHNHPVLDALSRASLNTIRIVTLMFPNVEFELMYASLKMALGDDVQDTLHCVASDVDLETGQLEKARSVEPGESGLTHHPDTGARIEGIRLPFWDQALELVRNAHGAFPNLPIIGWDIAITPNGPTIIEANCGPKIGSIQAKSLKPLALSRFADLYWAWEAYKTKQELENRESVGTENH